ncbi:POTRA domain-containing protein [Aestuariivirga sp.]|uniref:POTRA domain-containing protein n=1 Tax=Aestuariivirga sp. TaxID=2650926 RepID=UPI0039E23412
MKYRFVIVAVLAFLLAGLSPVLAPQAFSSAAYADTISQIAIQGNQRIENETILSYLQIQPGETATSEKIDEFRQGAVPDRPVFRRPDFPARSRAGREG